jgi:hypothetical protein
VTQPALQRTGQIAVILGLRAVDEQHTIQAPAGAGPLRCGGRGAGRIPERSTVSVPVHVCPLGGIP